MIKQLQEFLKSDHWLRRYCILSGGVFYFDFFCNIYDEVRCTYNIPSLGERRFELCRTFFQRIIRDKSNVFWQAIFCQPIVILNLRCARQYPTTYARTNRYKNHYCIWTKLLAVICVCVMFYYVSTYVRYVCMLV